MCVYTLMVGIASAAIYSVLEPISEATDLTIGNLNAGTGVRLQPLAVTIHQKLTCFSTCS